MVDGGGCLLGLTNLPIGLVSVVDDPQFRRANRPVRFAMTRDECPTCENFADDVALIVETHPHDPYCKPFSGLYH